MPRRVRIVSHNAFWLQGYPFRSTDPGPPNPDVLEGLSRLYATLKPDALCLQELQDAAACEALGQRLGMANVHCPGNRHPQYGGGVFWLQGGGLDKQSSGGWDPARMWQVCEIPLRENGARPLRIANVHLTSARQMGEDAASCSRCEDLEELLLAAPEVDVICGDMNEDYGGPVSALLMEKGFFDAAVLTQSDLVSTGMKKGRSDQIWVCGEFASSLERFHALPWEWLGASFRGKQYLSDHLCMFVDVTV